MPFYDVEVKTIAQISYRHPLIEADSVEEAEKKILEDMPEFIDSWSVDHIYSENLNIEAKKV
jgi:hypothetical protein